ncbi:MAG: tRNA uridine-5-carboxymethylaminomethyl(34) synthesis GTPase MnmE [Burkholderiaceae bacterium]|jgi:tRNA modification GTPase|nr:tRNA uridine-5-carboxymethylaminomethyl(34) synthesis GTPase MnmE [Burkholderiaceae bacterium]
MLTANADPIVAIATAPGRGAVGIVRLSSGAPLGALAHALTGRALTARMASYGPFLDGDGSAIDHGLALYFPAPHSYTGENVLELQAHGGPVVLQLLLARCLGAAAQPISAADARPLLARLRLARPGEFTERAFLNGKIDLAQATAVADLIDASTEAAARSATRSLAGALSGRIGALRDALIDLRLLIEATLDFPEEETDVLSGHDVRARLAALRRMLADVRDAARQGALLREGITVVIAGQPNAGKSSLLNALAGAELAIVTPTAGTTRDVLRQTIQIEGVPLHVLDTAGLRAASSAAAPIDAAEQMGIERAWQHIAQADAVLWLRDLTRRDAPDYAARDAELAQTLAQKAPKAVPIIEVWNKSDAAPPDQTPPPATLDGGAAAAALTLSARTGDGLQALRARLLAACGWQATPAGGLFMARQQHLQALQLAAERLDAASALLAAPAPALDLLAEELRQAQNALGAITGEFTSDDLLGTIFSRFCIGK